MRGRRRSTAGVRNGSRRRCRDRSWARVSAIRLRSDTIERARSVPALPRCAEIEAGREKREARDDRPRPAGVLVGEGQRAVLAVGLAQEREYAEHDPGEAHQGEKREQIPHRILEKVWVRPATPWMKLRSGRGVN